MTDWQYTDALERFAIDTLRCSLDDLELIQLIYSEVVDSLNIDIMELYRKHNTLDGIIYELYDTVTKKLADKLELFIDYEPSIDIINKAGTEVITLLMTDNIKNQIRKYVEELRTTEPCWKNGKICFNSFLDDDHTLDWDELSDTNVDYIIQYLADKKLKITKADKEK